jgi:hypothetical protein
MTTQNAIGQAGLAADYILGTMRLTCSEGVREAVRETVRLAVLGQIPAEKMTVDSDWWKPAYRAAEQSDKTSLMFSIEVEAAKIDAVVSLMNSARVSDESVMSALVSAVSKMSGHAV